MTVNGDEGEPGTFKDRFWLERKPHQMLEGAFIAANIVECEKIYIYMRDEYPEVLEILKIYMEKLKPSKPDERVGLEVEDTTIKDKTARGSDLVTPIGKGQRSLIVAPPRTEKTVIL